MKYSKSVRLLLMIAMLGMSPSVFAQSSRLSTNLERAVLTTQDQAQRLQEASVVVTATLQKPVKMSSMVCRPLRGCKDQVVSYKIKTNTCRGTLEQGGQRVYTPANCVDKKDYTLVSVKLQFSNGKVAVGTKNALAIKEKVACIAVSPSVTQGLRGLPFLKVPEGQSLQEFFGEGVVPFLINFFHQKGIPAHHHYRLGGSASRLDLNLQVGEPIIYKGKVVALVKKVPLFFRRNLSGKVSESPLAIIRP